MCVVVNLHVSLQAQTLTKKPTASNQFHSCWANCCLRQLQAEAVLPNNHVCLLPVLEVEEPELFPPPSARACHTESRVEQRHSANLLAKKEYHPSK